MIRRDVAFEAVEECHPAVTRPSPEGAKDGGESQPHWTFVSIEMWEDRSMIYENYFVLFSLQRRHDDLTWLEERVFQYSKSIRTRYPETSVLTPDWRSMHQRLLSGIDFSFPSGGHFDINFRMFNGMESREPRLQGHRTKEDWFFPNGVLKPARSIFNKISV